MERELEEKVNRIRWKVVEKQMQHEASKNKQRNRKISNAGKH